jgi:hypothetical protein
VVFSKVRPREGQKGPRRDGWFQTGGITFAYSDLHGRHVRFERFETEDALNVFTADVQLSDLSFEQVASDAFDGDFITGRLENISLSRIGGDGLDFSGSHLVIRGVDADDIGDKAVSVGEASQVRVAQLRTNHSRFALVAKDGSRVEAEGIESNDTWVAIAAYTKKSEFGGARIHVRDLDVKGQGFASLVQEGSEATVDGQALPILRFDAGDLYGP